MARAGGLALGWTLTLWTLVVLGGYFLVLAPRLPEDVPYALTTPGAIALWAIGAALIGLRHSKGWLKAGHAAGLTPGPEDQHGLRSLLMPDLHGVRDGIRLYAETDFTAGYTITMPWTRVSANIERTRPDSLRIERRGRSQKLKKKIGPTSEDHDRAIERGEAVLAAFDARGGDPEERKKLEAALEQAHRSAKLHNIEDQALKTDDPAFDKRFKVEAEPAEAATRVLDDETRAAITQVPYLDRLTVADGRIEARLPGHVVSPRIMEATVAAVLTVAKRLRP